MSIFPAEDFELKKCFRFYFVDRTMNKLTERLRLIKIKLPSKNSDTKALLVKFRN